MWSDSPRLRIGGSHAHQNDIVGNIIENNQNLEKLFVKFENKINHVHISNVNLKNINWDILKQYRGNRKWMLAGGLNHRNILEAIRKSNSKNVDVSSGVESSPGVKSKV